MSMYDWQLKEQEDAKKAKEYLLSLIPALKEAGAEKLVIHYDGEGDEGEIQWIHAWNDADEDHEDYYHGKTHLNIPLLDEQNNKIDEAACDIMSGLGIDWYNNEGGFGYVVLDVEAGKIKVDHNARVHDSVHSDHEV